jgi:uncharacterized protein
LHTKVLKTAEKEKILVNCVQKPKDEKPVPKDVPHLRIAKTNGDVLTRLRTDTSVAGGTSWLWASEEAYEAVDVLFVDEAAQMSLAEVLAVSQSAKAVVLLGDPQQLEQPIQGSHPDGTDVSALDYIRDGHDTIGEDKGLFLEKTYRLNPDICSFTSELFYENRLSSIEGLERQIIYGDSRLSGSGLRFLPIKHVGNQNVSVEEVDAVEKLYNECLQNNLTYCDREGKIKAVTQEEILIVAPYNAQVFEIKKRLPDARVGTVDKFQGQEAAIVMYSMASSSPADAPRGMEFLYSLNRLNVATSRAKCLAVIVGSPDLFEASCRTPRQIQLANAFCRYLEVAASVLPLN